MTKIFSVSNADELMNALASAKGGDTIELAGGDYGLLNLEDGKTGFNVNFHAEVTIRSAQTDQPASFSGIDLRGVSNLTFDGLVFDYQFSQSDPTWIRPFQIGYESQYVTIKNSVFDGDPASGVSEIDDGYGSGIGLSVRSSSNVSIENNEFSTWHRAATYSQVDNLRVTENEVYDIRSDGFNFAEVKSVLIENNYLHDFQGSPDSSDHRDMIQFWTNGTSSPTMDVIIRSNILDIGEGSFTQSIFMRNDQVDRGLAGADMFYENILIENNSIYNGHANAITVGETNGLTIRNNSVLQSEGEMHGLSGSMTIPKINVSSASTSVSIVNNITSTINGYEGQPSWSIEGNAFLQPEDYIDSFVTSSLNPVAGAHKFIVLPDGMIENLQAGATRTQFQDAPDGLTPQFQVYSSASSDQTLVFDASLTVDTNGIVPETEADFLWTFGDGNSATGKVVQHEFATPGHHDVILTVTKDDTSTQAFYSTGIKGSDIVQFDAETGHFESLAYGEETSLDGIQGPLVKTSEGYALKLGGTSIQARVETSELSRFFDAGAFEMSMSLKADSSASWGEIGRIHQSFLASIDESGNFVLTLFFEDGSHLNVVSEGISMNDGNNHDVAIRFDESAGFAEIEIDGMVAAREGVSGALDGGSWGLMFGNPWGKQTFGGEMSAFTLSADSRDYPIYDGEMLPVSSTETINLYPSTINPGTEDLVTPESERAPTEATDEPAMEEESGLTEPLLKNGYQLDIASIATSDTVKLHDDAHITETADGLALSFDGKKDYAALGRLTEFEASQKIAFSVDFTSDNSSDGAQRLVWNHLKVGLTLEGDSLVVHAGNVEDHFSKGFKVDGLGLNDGNQHSAIVMVDAESDRLQIVVNGEVVLDERDTDFDFVGAGGHEWGWVLGTPWNRWFEGEVHDFQVSDEFTFVGISDADGSLLI